MKFTEVLRIAWEAILKNKVRSFLTMLGIIIGVGAVIIMVAISAGTEATIQEQITSLGSNLLFVQSSFGRGGSKTVCMPLYEVFPWEQTNRSCKGPGWSRLHRVK